MIEYNIQFNPSDDMLAEIVADATRYQNDFKSYQDAYNYFYKALEESYISSFCQ